MLSLTILKPDDFHIHLRAGALLKILVPQAARQYRRVAPMPNLIPPVTTTAQALKYQEEILQAVPEGVAFEPLMSLYLTDDTPATEIASAKASGKIPFVKLYPAQATTNSAAGVTDYQKIYPALEAMEKHDLVLRIHAEVTDPDIDVFAREKVFLETMLPPLIKNFPGLKIVVEHLTTEFAVNFIREASANIAATLAPHYLLFNRNDLLAAGLKPHLYCFPIYKTAADQQALIEAATSGEAKFFAGSDSAPHFRRKKECALVAGGCYHTLNSLELYAQIFDQAGKMANLEKFVSINGANFCGLPLNTEKITLIKKAYQVPEKIACGSEELIPMVAGEKLEWQVT